MRDTYASAAAAIRSARALVVTAGAGMGVDSGLPDFRGDQGFWKAYPPYERLGISFMDAANPAHFEADAPFGWGFYGHRARLYRETTPHGGFAILLRWIERLDLASFVVTSNVDGQFQKAGFAADRVYEVHGSIHHLQCTEPCSGAIWPNEEDVPVDEATMRARRIPRCRRCRAVARPNILMFGDGAWLQARSDAQRGRLEAWLDRHERDRLVVLELGAGTAIPTIRWTSERLGGRAGATVVRVNPREPEIEAPHFSIAGGAREALERIDAALGS
ncbi:MAG: SIR2 family NAD-dependent protein deacylase [Anaeromyxobacteraceae bacterium]